MKKLTLFLIFNFLLLTFNCVNAQKYYPLVDTNKLWGIHTIIPVYPSISYSYLLKFTEDTTIKGIVYKKVMAHDSLSNKWLNDGYIRETANEKVYYYSRTNYIDTGLLYNFNVKKGDTNILQRPRSLGFNIFSVDSIDSILIGKQFRKRFFLNDSGSGGFTGKETWIEGIGSLCGVLTVGQCALIGGENYLICCSENDTLLYGNPEHNYCYQRTVNIKKNEENNYFIDIFPNPVNESSVISYQLPARTSVSIKVYDFTGREVSTLMNSTQDKGAYKINLNANNYKDGMYFIKFETNNGVNILKFIKD